MAHVVVTGGTGGIGKATAREIASRGHDVTITGRDAQRTTEAAAEIAEASGRPVRTVVFDLASLASVRSGAEQLRDEFPEIDVLIANAGVAVFGRRRTTDDGFERQFGVNHLGHFLLTDLLADRITQRVVIVSSLGYTLADTGMPWDDLQWEHDFDGWKAYGASKLANLYFTWELADRLAPRGVTVNALHPGFVDTDLGYKRPEEGGKLRPAGEAVPTTVESTGTTVDLSVLGEAVTAADGARTSVFLALDPSVADVTGAYFDEQQRRQDVTPLAADREAAARLWAVSEELIAATLGAP